MALSVPALVPSSVRVKRLGAVDADVDDFDDSLAMEETVFGGLCNRNEEEGDAFVFVSCISRTCAPISRRIVK